MKHSARYGIWILTAIFPLIIGCDAGFSHLASMEGAFLSSAEGTFERTLAVGGPVELNVSTGAGSIMIRPGSGGTVRIIGEIRAKSDTQQRAEEKARYIAANPPIEQNGNSIRIGHIDREEYQRNVSISYTIETPPDTRVDAETGSGNQEIAGVRGTVEASTGSGNLRLSDIGGEVQAETGSGNIEVASVARGLRASAGSGNIRGNRISGSVKLSTGSGDIDVEQVGEGDAQLETGSGSIEASGVNGALHAGTGSGNIRAGGTPLRGWSVETGSGGVTLRLAPESSCDLDARTDSGHVSLRQTLAQAEVSSRREVRGKIRGGGPAVHVRTSSGNITIE